MSTTTAVVYCRISRDKTGEGLGVDRQESDCRALAKQLGWNVSKVYVDNDISASSGRRRPSYDRMLADLADGSAAAIIAWHTDRLHRRPVELEDFITLCETHRVDIRTVQAGEMDLSTASGRMVARMLGAAARHEVEHKSDRIKRAREQSAQRGDWHGGRRCYGWEPDGMTPREAEADVLRSAVDSIISGVSLRQIVSDLNRAGVKTATGSKPWDSTKLRSAVLAPRNAGLSAHKGEIIGKAKWPAIIDEAKWTAARAILSDPARRTNGRGGSVRWLGSGLYICGVCGSTDVRMSVVEGRKRYRCRNRVKGDPKPHVGRDATLLDEYVQEVLIARLSEPDAAKMFVANDGGGVDVGALQIESRALSERLDELVGLHVAGSITKNQLAKGSEMIQNQQADIADRIAAASMDSPLAGLAGAEDVAAAWAGLSLGTQREVLRLLVRVTILPAPPGRRPNGTYFDPEFIQFDWVG